METTRCPFCQSAESGIFAENDFAAAFPDGFPIAEGHTLVVAKRHVASLFELSEEEQEAVWTPDEPTVWLGVRYGEITLMRPQPLICVGDVEASSRWYQQLLGCRSDHGGPNDERLVHSGNLILQLHRWEVEHHHGRIGDTNDVPPGNGLLLWFEVDDFDAAIARAGAMGAEIIMPRHRNPPDRD